MTVQVSIVTVTDILNILAVIVASLLFAVGPWFLESLAPPDERSAKLYRSLRAVSLGMAIAGLLLAFGLTVYALGRIG